MESVDRLRQLKVSNHAKQDLDLLVDEELKLGLHAKTAATKASQTVHILKRTFGSHPPRTF